MVEMYGLDKVAIINLKFLRYMVCNKSNSHIQQLYVYILIKSSSVMKCQAQWIISIGCTKPMVYR